MQTENQQAAEQVLGYLNFSSGAPDASLLANLNQLWESVRADADAAPSTWRLVGGVLESELDRIRGSNPTFQDTSQAEAALAHLRG